MCCASIFGKVVENKGNNHAVGVANDAAAKMQWSILLVQSNADMRKVSKNTMTTGAAARPALPGIFVNKSCRIGSMKIHVFAEFSPFFSSCWLVKPAPLTVRHTNFSPTLWWKPISWQRMTELWLSYYIWLPDTVKSTQRRAAGVHHRKHDSLHVAQCRFVNGFTRSAGPKSSKWFAFSTTIWSLVQEPWDHNKSENMDDSFKMRSSTEVCYPGAFLEHVLHVGWAPCWEKLCPWQLTLRTVGKCDAKFKICQRTVSSKIHLHRKWTMRLTNGIDYRHWLRSVLKTIL